MTKWCPVRDTLNVLAKAFGWPGYGYSPPKLKIDGTEIEAPQQLVHKANEVQQQVELLEWELRREPRLRR